MKPITSKLRRSILNSKSESGWSYIELLIVIGVTAAIGTIAGVRLLNDRNANVASAVGQLVMSDLAFAQNLAMSTNKAVVFNASAGTDSYDSDKKKGKGHDAEHRGAGTNGKGRGHGYGYGHAHHCDEACDEGGGEGGGGGYGIIYSDGSSIDYPAAASVTNISATVTINPAVNSFYFDSVGRLVIPDFNWESGQTTLILMTINDEIGVQVSRETGKSELVKL